MPGPVAPPPAEIANDPARAAIYDRTHRADPWRSSTFYRVEGCGESAVYACSIEPNADGTSSPSCLPLSGTP